MLKPHQLMFLSTLITGTIISISANSWFTAWLGLEINLLSMIPIMLNKLDQLSTESSIKYFLTQALASVLLISSTCVALKFNNSVSMELTELLVMAALMIKAGLPPFHFWFPNILVKTLWNQTFILLTWQKVAPLLLMSSLSFNKIVTMAMMSAIVGAAGGVNQYLIKSLMAYSSITHSGWILLSMSAGLMLWSLYFSIYCLLAGTIIFILKKTHFNSLNVNNLKNENLMNKYLLAFNMMSLAGLPPFLGFMAKLTLISFFLSVGLFTPLAILILSSLTALYFYARIFYSIIMTTSKNKNMNMKFNSPLNFTVTVATSLNIFTPIISSLY